MKKIIYPIYLLIVITLFSCKENEDTIYDGNYENNQTLINFSKSIVNFGLENNTSGSIDIKVSSSTISSSSRTYNLEIVADDSSANPANYTLPSTVTIPANSYFGTFTLDGVDNDLLTTVKESLVLKITGLNSKENTSNTLTVLIYEGCPVANAVFLVINFDGYGSETSWELKDSQGNVVMNAPQGSYSDGQESASEDLCITDGEYTFIIYDAYGDGLSDGSSIGNYKLSNDQTVFAEGSGAFGDCGGLPANTLCSDSTTFTK